MSFVRCDSFLHVSRNSPYGDIYQTVKTSLYGFTHPSHYEGMLIQPIRKIKESLIISEWENIKRIVVSLAMKTTTQSIIVSKLSSYARKNKTRQALWEYDNIIKSLYLLDYIDSPPLRQNVQSRCCSREFETYSIVDSRSRNVSLNRRRDRNGHSTGARIITSYVALYQLPTVARYASKRNLSRKFGMSAAVLWLTA